MEEWVGGIWDRWITKTARRDHPEAAVRLADMEKTLGVVFRALGGDAGLRPVRPRFALHGKPASTARSNAPRNPVYALLYFAMSATRHPRRGTPALLGRRTPSALADRAGGVLCIAK